MGWEAEDLPSVAGLLADWLAEAGLLALEAGLLALEAGLLAA